MCANSMDTCSYFHNNDPTKQKNISNNISNLIYIFIHLYMSQLFTFIKTIYFSCSYILMCIYMYKHIVKMPPKFKELGKYLITYSRAC